MKFNKKQIDYLGVLSTTKCKHCNKLYGQHYSNSNPPKCYKDKNSVSVYK